MGLSIKTERTFQAVSVTEIAFHRRLHASLSTPYTGAEEDALLRLATAATDLIESFTGRPPCETEYEETWDGASALSRPLVLSRGPVSEVSAVEYLTGPSTYSALTVDTQYQVLADRLPVLVVPPYGSSWPSALAHYASVRVTYKAGAATAGAVDSRLHAAALALAGTWYEHREDILAGTIVAEIPAAVRRLLWPMRIFL